MLIKTSQLGLWSYLGTTIFHLVTLSGFTNATTPLNACGPESTIPTQDRSKLLALSNVFFFFQERFNRFQSLFIRPVVGTARVFTLKNKAKTSWSNKLNIWKPSVKKNALQPLQITWKSLGLTSSGIILTFLRRAKHYRENNNFSFNSNLNSEKLDK